jgi:hypothetical protein
MHQETKLGLVVTIGNIVYKIGRFSFLHKKQSATFENRHMGF